MFISDKRIEELVKEKEELLGRHQEYSQVMKNIETRLTQIDGVLMEVQRAEDAVKEAPTDE